MEIDVVICFYDIFYSWLFVVGEQVVKILEEVVEKDKENCVDICNLCLVIIDDEIVWDFDDVVYCEFWFWGGYCLLVVIVDVFYYV